MTIRARPEPRAPRVPGSVTQLGVTMRFSLLDYARSRRFVILLGIALIVSAVLSGVVAFYRPSSYLSSNLAFFSSWWGMTAVFVVILSGIFFGGDAISGEFHNKTGYFVLPNPIRRSSLYFGKFLAAFVAASLCLLTFALVAVANAAFYFGAAASFPGQFAEALFFSWCYLAAVLGLTFLFSSLFKSNSYSILVSAIVLLFAFQLIQALLQSLAQAEPWFILNYAAGTIGGVMASTYPAHTSTVHRFGVSFTTFSVTVPEGLAIMASYLVVTSLLGLAIFEKKDFT